ncbi:MAG: type I-B CRISPR-associated protein Cas8b1/Cst1 [Caloramator sp.]|nr:type I-B CRISPR-associated protein Cas8b1/Cst1 [Caloramator sp.]
MQVRVCLNDWFYNMGIVGMIRILEHAKGKGKKISFVLGDDYLEIDDNTINNFHNYYFDYFCDEYIEKEYIKIQNKFNQLKAKLGVDIIKEVENFLSETKLDDKATKKGFEKEVKDILDAIKKLKKNCDSNELANLINKIESLLKNNDVIEKYALDHIRSMMYDNFFGQMSFLQKSLANKSIDEHKQIMFKDFIRPVIIDIKIKEYLQNNDLNGLINFLENELGKEENLKGYKNCLKKSKNNISNFNESLHANSYCSICNIYPSFREDFNESRFLILGVSNENASNFFWDFITKYPICNLCKLVILCAPAGVVKFDKFYMEKEEWWKRNFYTFVNLDTNLEDLLKKNESLKNKMSSDNPYKEFIMDILEQAREESIWTLQNILFVEFSGQYQSKKSNLRYMHINKFVASYFKNYSNETIEKIKNKKFKMELIDKILQNYDINEVIFIKLKDFIKNNYNGLDIYYSTLSKALLNCFKVKGDENKVKNKVYTAFYAGRDMREYLKKNKSDNKISSLAYRLLNTAKVGNKKDFMDTVLRLYVNSELEMPRIFLEAFYEDAIDFETIAQSFIAGLITETKEVEKDE